MEVSPLRRRLAGDSGRDDILFFCHLDQRPDSSGRSGETSQLTLSSRPKARFIGPKRRDLPTHPVISTKGPIHRAGAERPPNSPCHLDQRPDSSGRSGETSQLTLSSRPKARFIGPKRRDLPTHTVIGPKRRDLPKSSTPLTLVSRTNSAAKSPASGRA